MRRKVRLKDLLNCLTSEALAYISLGLNAAANLAKQKRTKLDPRMELKSIEVEEICDAKSVEQ